MERKREKTDQFDPDTDTDPDAGEYMTPREPTSLSTCPVIRYYASPAGDQVVMASKISN